MRERHGGSGPYWTVAAVFWILPAAVLLGSWLTRPDHNPPGQCEGIGFGCSLTLKDSVAFVALLVHPVVFGLGAGVMFVVAAVRHRRRRR